MQRQRDLRRAQDQEFLESVSDQKATRALHLKPISVLAGCVVCITSA